MVAGPGCGPGAGHRLDGSGCLGDEGRLLLAEVCRDQNGLTARAGYEVGEDLGDLPVGLGDDRSGTWVRGPGGSASGDDVDPSLAQRRPAVGPGGGNGVRHCGRSGERHG